MKKQLLIAAIVLPLFVIAPTVGATPTFQSDLYTRAKAMSDANGYPIDWSHLSSYHVATAAYSDGSNEVFVSDIPLFASNSLPGGGGLPSLAYNDSSTFHVYDLYVNYSDHSGDGASIFTQAGNTPLFVQGGGTFYYLNVNTKEDYTGTFNSGLAPGVTPPVSTSHSIFPTGVATSFIDKAENAVKDNMLPILLVGGFIIGLSIILTMLDMRADRKYLEKYKKTWGM